MAGSPSFSRGQRWISNAEPELGIGQVVASDQRQVTIRFALSETERTYSARQAPLTRVRFNVGDVVESAEGWSIQVESVREAHGLIVYSGRDGGSARELIETGLKADMVFSRPEERLFTHQVDDPAWFDLRVRTLEQRARLAESPARGLLGPRVALIPHQIYIGDEVANRFAPRVLLADEVGLGKTIEAGLIIHQQMSTGKAERVLILVPPSLTFQWFVEMIRRFNLQFSLLDEERCRQIETVYREGDGFDLEESEAAVVEDDRPVVSAFNPFEAQQLVLCSIDLFTLSERRLEQATQCEWDLLVVDEAHHLAWEPGGASPEYRAVERLARSVRGVLLLTATPEQLGKTGHFARLKLIDPDRFFSYDAFVEEEVNYAPLVERANRILLGSTQDAREAARALAEESGLPSANEMARDELIQELLDRHGTGRVLFRNVRSSVSGFSERVFRPVPLALPDQYRATRGAASPVAFLYPEILLEGAEAEQWPLFDPRAGWLGRLVAELQGEKVLLICALKSTAERLEEFLRNRLGLRTALFHEELDLIARDRAAAYFAEADRGAQILVASEIGSEGRNFQFAQHLVLFDLPYSPDLLEQRIGRLDRIGQRGIVTIHLPYFTGSAQEVLCRWYHEALNLFVETNPAAQEIHGEMEEELLSRLAAAGRADETEDDLDRFIARSRQRNEARREMLAAGRDRLLELNSHRPQRSADLIATIQRDEGGVSLQEYMERACELYGLDLEPLSDTAWVMTPTEGMVRHTAQSLETQQRYRFPELPDDGVRVTFDRDTALAREDLMFLSWESPMVRQAIDLITSDLLGNSVAMVIADSGFPRGTLLLETIHVIESIASPVLQLDRFLPPHAIRSLIDPSGNDLSDRHPYRSFLAEQLEFDLARLFDIIDAQTEILKRMLEKARAAAAAKLDRTRQEAAGRMERLLDGEIERLTALARVNPNVRQEELDYLRETRRELESAIRRAGSRLDAMRILIAT